MSRTKWLLLVLVLVQLAGVVAISYGCYLVYEPVGYIVLGGWLLLVAHWATKVIEKRESSKCRAAGGEE